MPQGGFRPENTPGHDSGDIRPFVPRLAANGLVVDGVITDGYRYTTLEDATESTLEAECHASEPNHELSCDRVAQSLADDVGAGFPFPPCPIINFGDFLGGETKCDHL